MTLERLDPCCNCPDHQRPYRNEDNWIITGLPEHAETWEAWTAVEWKRHCDRYAPSKGERELEIVRRAEKESLFALAKEYGITTRTIYRYIEKHRRAA